MDEFLKELLLQTPNLAVAVVVLFWQRRTIDQLMANQTMLIDRLLRYVDEERLGQRLAEIISEDEKI